MPCWQDLRQEEESGRTTSLYYFRQAYRTKLARAEARFVSQWTNDLTLRVSQGKITSRDALNHTTCTWGVQEAL
ncbi:hypothetical protein CLOM_g5470 [Closterium sp. NIES-68]|nr:hypothetical protein CLOM_g5470 [Closterium sp. NIES-68]GJP61102.1 hypothetical protein CLOP_g18308 [Closterium sp. NIES-67]